MGQTKITATDQELIAMYETTTTEEIGALLGVSGRAIRHRLAKAGVDLHEGQRRHKRGKRSSPATEFKTTRDLSAIEKACRVCGVVKPLDGYHVDRYAKDGRRSTCRECVKKERRAYYEANLEQMREKRKAWYYANVERARESGRINQMKIKYGLAPEVLTQAIEDQGGKCPICQRQPKRWAVDHDHATGAIRGLICCECNSGIGMLGDDPDRIETAARYIRDGGSWKYATLT